MIRWLEELIAAIQTGSGGVNVRKKTQVYLLLHLTLCLSDPPRVVRGHRVVHSGHFWVSSQKATCSESHQPKGPLYPNKKNNLCYVTHWCCCCCLWQWSRRRKPERGGKRCQVKMTWTEGWREGWRKKGRGGVGWFAAAHELHRHDFCTLCTFILLSIHCYTEATQLTAAWHHWLLPPSH